jgi:hypothetical protein
MWGDKVPKIFSPLGKHHPIGWRFRENFLFLLKLGHPFCLAFWHKNPKFSDVWTLELVPAAPSFSDPQAWTESNIISFSDFEAFDYGTNHIILIFHVLLGVLLIICQVISVFMILQENTNHLLAQFYLMTLSNYFKNSSFEVIRHSHLKAGARRSWHWALSWGLHIQVSWQPLHR